MANSKHTRWQNEQHEESKRTNLTGPEEGKRVVGLNVMGALVGRKEGGPVKGWAVTGCLDGWDKVGVSVDCCLDGCDVSGSCDGWNEIIRTK